MTLTVADWERRIASNPAAILKALDRIEARESLEAFGAQFLPAGFTPSLHHLAFIKALERVERGECKRLMIFAPPGAAKSTWVSRLFPAWYLGRNPHHNIIAASHTFELAADFGRYVRNLVDGEDFRDIFHFGVSRDNAAAHHWATDGGGEYVAAGVGKAIAGRRARLAIIDDPVKSREEAQSAQRLEKIWQWKVNDLWPRLLPDAAVVLMHTRWSDYDLAGRCLEDMQKGGEPWETLILRMEAEEDDPLGRAPGERLWPEWFTEQMVAQAKRDTLSWASLYQQRPQPEGGHYFQRDWIRWYDPARVPAHLSIYMAADYAVTDGAGDWTVFGVIGVDPDDNIYLLDWRRIRTASDVWVETACDLIELWRPIEFIQEKGQIEKGVGPFMAKRQRERNAYCSHKLYASAADKPTRAQAIRGRMAQGKVYFPIPGATTGNHIDGRFNWVDLLVDEVVRFPMPGLPDDQVDVLSLFGRRLAEMARPSVPPPPVDWSSVAAEKPTWNSVVEQMDRRDTRQRGRIS
jgi:hypothetical protein